MYAGEPDKGIFNIRYDFDKSNGSYIFDKNTNKSYLDFFGMFSSIPIGYNHPIFSTESFQDEIRKVSKFVAGTEEDAMLPIPVFYDLDTKKIIKDSLPKELREEYKDITI